MTYLYVKDNLIDFDSMLLLERRRLFMDTRQQCCLMQKTDHDGDDGLVI
jgi:hypothetical protein